MQTCVRQIRIYIIGKNWSSNSYVITNIQYIYVLFDELENSIFLGRIGFWLIFLVTQHNLNSSQIYWIHWITIVTSQLSAYLNQTISKLDFHSNAQLTAASSSSVWNFYWILFSYVGKSNLDFLWNLLHLHGSPYLLPIIYSNFTGNPSLYITYIVSSIESERKKTEWEVYASEAISGSGKRSSSRWYDKN